MIDLTIFKKELSIKENFDFDYELDYDILSDDERILESVCSEYMQMIGRYISIIVLYNELFPNISGSYTQELINIVEQIIRYNKNTEHTQQIIKEAVYSYICGINYEEFKIENIIIDLLYPYIDLNLSSEEINEIENKLIVNIYNNIYKYFSHLKELLHIIIESIYSKNIDMLKRYITRHYSYIDNKHTDFVNLEESIYDWFYFLRPVDYSKKILYRLISEITCWLGISVISSIFNIKGNFRYYSYDKDLKMTIEHRISLSVIELQKYNNQSIELYKKLVIDKFVNMRISDFLIYLNQLSSFIKNMIVDDEISISGSSAINQKIFDDIEYNVMLCPLKYFNFIKNKLIDSANIVYNQLNK